jgi:molybdate transport system substrate-binding protein
MATRQVLAELAEAYRRRAGCSVDIESVAGLDAARRVRAGEETDILVLASNVIEELEAEGHLLSGSRADFARSGIAAAVPAGAPRPSMATAEEVKQATLQARKLCYSTGPSGIQLRQLWERWGIVDALAEKAIQAPPGVPVATIIARGEADLGFQQLSELIGVSGIDIVGPLPPDIQAITTFATAICSRSSQRHAARALIEYLTSREVEDAKRRHGMVPP